MLWLIAGKLGLAVAAFVMSLYYLDVAVIKARDAYFLWHASRQIDGDRDR